MDPAALRARGGIIRVRPGPFHETLRKFAPRQRRGVSSDYRAPQQKRSVAERIRDQGWQRNEGVSIPMPSDFDHRKCPNCAGRTMRLTRVEPHSPDREDGYERHVYHCAECANVSRFVFEAPPGDGRRPSDSPSLQLSKVWMDFDAGDRLALTGSTPSQACLDLGHGPIHANVRGGYSRL